MATGTVKKVVSDRGFGFITAEDGKDYFFHRDGLERSLDFDRLAGARTSTSKSNPALAVREQSRSRQPERGTGGPICAR